MTTPAELAGQAEHTLLPSGSGDRFAGYAVMGLPFSTGNVLAMRRFPASSIGPAYTSVWHGDPSGRWVFWQNKPDEQACGRYFSAAVSQSRMAEIDLVWPDDTTLQVDIPEAELSWTSKITSTRVTRVLDAFGRILPDRAWRSQPFLSAMGPVAGTVLRAGKIKLAGTAPNGQHFLANPQRLWVIDAANARLEGDDLGTPAPLAQQARLGDFWIPQRGIFTIGRAFFES